MVLLIVEFTVIAIVLVWRIYQLLRSPHYLPAWAVTGCLVCGGLGQVLSLESTRHWADQLVAKGFGIWLCNILLYLGLCSLIIFFRGSALGPERWWRALYELIGFAIQAVMLGVIVIATPAPLRGASLGPVALHSPGVALFYLVGSAYFAYGLSACAAWIAIRTRRTTDRMLRIGLRITGAGAALLVLAVLCRVAYLVIGLATGALANGLLALGGPLIALGTILFFLGVVVPGFASRIAAMARRRRYRQRYRLLEPLWAPLAARFPQLTLRTHEPRRLERLLPRAVWRRYYRRVIEIRDGIVLLSPYLPGDLTDTASTDPRRAAAQVTDALRTMDEGTPPPSQAHTVLAGGNDLDSDVVPLLALAQALREHSVTPE